MVVFAVERSAKLTLASDLLLIARETLLLLRPIYQNVKLDYSTVCAELNGIPFLSRTETANERRPENYSQFARLQLEQAQLVANTNVGILLNLLHYKMAERKGRPVQQ